MNSNDTGLRLISHKIEALRRMIKKADKRLAVSSRPKAGVNFLIGNTIQLVVAKINAPKGFPELGLSETL
jgi:hypothetical protein